MQKKEYSTEIGGKVLTATFSDLAEQANGSCELTYGNTRVLATAVMSSQKREGSDFFPLTVDYEEKFYAAGRILGSRFVRREGRPTEEAILSARAVDRTIRPLFDSRIRNEIQIVITVLSIDEDDPDMLAINAASLALATSDIPWNGPVSAVRVGKRAEDGGHEINPTYSLREDGKLSFDLLVCGKDGLVNMIELGGQEVLETHVGDGLEVAQKEIEMLEAFQKTVVAEIGKEKKSLVLDEVSDQVRDDFQKLIQPKLGDALYSAESKKAIGDLEEEWKSHVREAFPDEPHSPAYRMLEDAIDHVFHERVLREGKRPDGRAPNEVRSLFAKAGDPSPVLHGAGVFYRGGTHIFSALTLGGPGESQVLDGMEIQSNKRFIHHYNFPPFSVGETGRVGGFNRRMIGHGALAEKALSAVIPHQDTFPYTIRIVSEVFASNGSSSMGSVCGGTLALMDAGVPISSPVAGIAMGLALGEDGSYCVLTDIQGPEDHHGDMDLKVAGTRNGVTAMQMDVKVLGVTIKILREALSAAKDARYKILDVIEEEIPAPREELSPRAPKIAMMSIKKDQIGLVIGPGGKTVNGIREETNTEIDIEEDGTIYITGIGDGPDRAKKLIEDLTHVYKAGERARGEVTRITDFGAFVKIGRDAEGLVHISEIAPFRIEKVSDALALGETVEVVVKEVDEKDRINLSIKAADPDFAKRKGLQPQENNSSGKTNSTNHHGRGKGEEPKRRD